MLNAIQFLEAMGQRPAPLTASVDSYVMAVCESKFEDRQRAALLARDPFALGEALGARVHMVCAVCTPDDDQHEVVPDDGDKDDNMVPDDEESPKDE